MNGWFFSRILQYTNVEITTSPAGRSPDFTNHPGQSYTSCIVIAMTPRFEDLIEWHHDEIFSYLWRLLGRARGSDVTLDAEDLVQEVFMRAYQAFPKLRQNSNRRAWLYKIATNCALTRLKQAKHRRDNMTAFKDIIDAGDTSPTRAVMRRQLYAAVDGLSPKQRACVTLRYFNELDYPEIAEIVGCSEASARANVYQSIRQLRGAFKEAI
jgi:RNA polymerase sigma-70 factor (ECF subfamily)